MKRILISGFLGFDNFGDEALLHVLIRDLLSLGVQKQNITVLSRNPDKTRKTYGVNAVNRWDFFDLVYVLLSHDLLIFLGGLFQDKTSFKSFLYYFFQLFIAGISQKIISFYGGGFGPFQRKISQILFNFGMKNVHLLSVRDQVSANLTSGERNILVTCDPVWSITPDYTFQDKIPNINWHLPVLGITMRNDKNLKDYHITNLADKFARVLHSMKDWQALLIPCMPARDLPLLLELQDLIIKRLPDKSRVSLIGNFNQFPIEQQAGILASCDVMVGMRYHGLLVPLINSKPIFAFIFDQKVKSLVEFSGQVGIFYKDDFEQPWSYFWQNLGHSATKAQEAIQKANELHKRNIGLLEFLVKA
ncbi:MAG: polysaccharide pyruvyl transferase family protein [Candidatus Melainabacteria bacterium]|nr:polysaccharide pyruvyl transferase family protein [Candidatus Melainabacteria bacterium]